MKDNSEPDMDAFAALWSQASHNPGLKKTLTSYVQQMLEEASRNTQ